MIRFSMKFRTMPPAAAVFLIAATICTFPLAVRAAPKKKAKAAVVSTPQDWGQVAADELERARIEMPKQKSATASSKAIAVSNSSANSETASDVLPTPATIRAEVMTTQSAIERSALRFTFLFEPYQPYGTGKFGAGEQVSYQNLPNSVLGQVDLRWLPFELGAVFGRPVSLGGYGAFGYSRQKLPLVAPSGFRYDDVALNSMRAELGLALGMTLNSKLNLEARLGAGRISMIQTSKYAEVVGTFERPYLLGALDLSYHFIPRFALVASVAKRTPLADGSGSIAFDPVTVSGGFLVQVR